MSQERYTLRVGTENHGSGADDGNQQTDAINDWSRLVLGSILPDKSFFQLFVPRLSGAIFDVINLQQQMIELFQQQQQQLADVLREWIESQADDIFEANLKLAKQGWFPDPNMPFGELKHVADAIATQPDAVDEHMQASWRAKLDEIEAELLRKHPVVLICCETFSQRIVMRSTLSQFPCFSAKRMGSATTASVRTSSSPTSERRFTAKPSLNRKNLRPRFLCIYCSKLCLYGSQSARDMDRFRV